MCSSCLENRKSLSVLTQKDPGKLSPRDQARAGSPVGEQWCELDVTVGEFQGQGRERILHSVCFHEGV